MPAAVAAPPDPTTARWCEPPRCLFSFASPGSSLSLSIPYNLRVAEPNHPRARSIPCLARDPPSPSMACAPPTRVQGIYDLLFPRCKPPRYGLALCFIFVDPFVSCRGNRKFSLVRSASSYLAELAIAAVYPFEMLGSNPNFAYFGLGPFYCTLFCTHTCTLM